MATVSNPATATSVVSVFGSGGAPANLGAYNRGGAQVAAGNSSAISTTAVGLALSQFNGVTKVTPLSGSASPTTMTGTKSGVPAKGTVTSNAVTVTGSLGSGSYTYAWALAGGTAASISLSGTTGATVQTTAASISGTASGTAVCTITDTVTGATFAVNVAISLSYSSTS